LLLFSGLFVGRLPSRRRGRDRAVAGSRPELELFSDHPKLKQLVVVVAGYLFGCSGETTNIDGSLLRDV
jgi:hypothetical protein